MGTYLNPGKTAFEEAVNSAIYIDKTEIIRYLNSVVNTKQKYVSVSRPRRFGKTMTADMICAYYDREADSRDLFSERLEHYKDNILLIGINYEKDLPNTDPKFKHHSCAIEKA
jgi:hypothetical protein